MVISRKEKQEEEENAQKEDANIPISFYDEAEVLALQTQKRVLLKSKAKQKEVHRNGECSARNYDYSYNLCHCCNHKAEKKRKKLKQSKLLK